VVIDVIFLSRYAYPDAYIVQRTAKCERQLLTPVNLAGGRAIARSQLNAAGGRWIADHNPPAAVPDPIVKSSSYLFTKYDIIQINRQYNTIGRLSERQNAYLTGRLCQ